MDYLIDTLTAKMARGETIFGTHSAWGGGMIPEIYASVGFDVVWIDTEHGHMDAMQIQNALIGARAGGIPAFVRVAWRDGVLAKPVLDIGADGVIFPMVNTAEEARHVVAACRYPPVGNRGYGPFRAARYGSVDGMEYIGTYSKKVWVIPQIEHIDAVRNLDEILKVPGIDAFIVGPCDLSGSLGHLGDVNHPEVKKAMDEIAAKTRAAGIPFGVSMIFDEELARDMVRRGASMIFADNEGSYIVNGSRKTLASLRRIAGEGK